MRHRPPADLDMSVLNAALSPRGHSVLLSVRREQDLDARKGGGDPPWASRRKSAADLLLRAGLGLLKRRPIIWAAVMLATCYLAALLLFFVQLDQSHLPNLLHREPCHAKDTSSAPHGAQVVVSKTGQPQLSSRRASLLARVLAPLRTPAPHMSYLGSYFCKHTDTKAVEEDEPVHEGCWPDKDDDKVYPQPEAVKNHTDLPLWWMAPFFDHTSFGHEAATLVLGMLRSGAIKAKQLWTGTTQGDCDYTNDGSMPFQDFKDLNASTERQNKCLPSIVVCHSLPPFWARPKNHWATCQPCPPIGYNASMVIGRAMAETDVYHSEFVRICNRMDEVWVPSQFSLDVLGASGVDRRRLRILPIPVNTTLYHPDHVKPLQLPQGKLVFGGDRRLRVEPPKGSSTTGGMQAGSQGNTDSAQDGVIGVDQSIDEAVASVQFTNAQVQQVMQALQAHADSLKLLKGVQQTTHEWQWAKGTEHPAATATAPTVKYPTVNVTALDGKLLYGSAEDGVHPLRSRPFTFVSCFKWEMRKGWDALLAAYLQEFTARDNVELYILTKPFLKKGDFAAEMRAWVVEHLKFSEEQLALLPTLYVISGHVSQGEYSGLYKSADAFVIASRGEGWGMPISEAMSMGLPVVATNWSGIADFVDEKTGYPVQYDLQQVPDDQPWWFRGARWANPRVVHLRQRLREVLDNPHTAAVKGRRARELMVERYTPEVVGQLLAKEYKRVKDMVESEAGCTYCHGSKWVAPPSDFKPQLYTGKEPFIRDPNAPEEEEEEEDPTKLVEVVDGSDVKSSNVIVVDFNQGKMDVHSHGVDAQQLAAASLA